MISVALLGAGVGEKHLQGYRALPDRFDVKRIVDRDTARAEALRAGDDFVVGGELDCALSDPDIDLIDICLPPHLHVPTTLAALEAGKNVICEKPLATSLAQTQQIMQACTTSGKNVYPVFQYRWGRAFSQLRHLIATGLAGAPQVAAMETHWSRGADYYSVPWRGTWTGEQGGAVLGHAIHSHDLLIHFLGPVDTVSAFTATRVNDIETEDCATVMFKMANGALATSNITLGAAGDETRLRFVFENLTATSGTNPYAPGEDKWQFAARHPDSQRHINEALAEAPVEPDGFAGFLSAVSGALLGAKTAAVSLQDGITSVELVSAIYHASRTGTSVHLPIHKDHPSYNGWQP